MEKPTDKLVDDDVDEEPGEAFRMAGVPIGDIRGPLLLLLAGKLLSNKESVGDVPNGDDQSDFTGEPNREKTFGDGIESAGGAVKGLVSGTLSLKRDMLDSGAELINLELSSKGSSNSNGCQAFDCESPPDRKFGFLGAKTLSLLAFDPDGHIELE